MESASSACRTAARARTGCRSASFSSSRTWAQFLSGRRESRGSADSSLGAAFSRSSSASAVYRRGHSAPDPSLNLGHYPVAEQSGLNVQEKGGLESVPANMAAVRADPAVDVASAGIPFSIYHYIAGAALRALQ